MEAKHSIPKHFILAIKNVNIDVQQGGNGQKFKKASYFSHIGSHTKFNHQIAKYE
jgi:hypothetical protein